MSEHPSLWAFCHCVAELPLGFMLLLRPGLPTRRSRNQNFIFWGPFFADVGRKANLGVPVFAYLGRKARVDGTEKQDRFLPILVVKLMWMERTPGPGRRPGPKARAVWDLLLVSPH